MSTGIPENKTRQVVRKKPEVILKRGLSIFIVTKQQQ